MWKLLKNDLIIEKTNKKNIIACIVVAIFVFGLFYYVKVENSQKLIDEKASEYQSVASALTKFQTADAMDYGNGSDLYYNLLQQQRHVVNQSMALKIDRPQLYLDTGIKLAELRANAFELEGYEKVATNLPTKTENQLDSILYEFMDKTGILVSQEALSFFPFLVNLFMMLGSFWFIFISIFSCGILIEEFRHTSLIKGYPVSFDQYVLAKSTSAMLIVCIFIVEIIICSLPFIYFYGVGNPKYPIAIYDGSFKVITTFEYIGIALVYMIFISIFTILLSVILNVILRNMYLTLFVQLLLFIAPSLFPALVSLVPFNPFNYMNFTNLLNGQSLELAKPIGLEISHGLIYLGVSIVLMLIAVKLFFTTGKLKKV
ncbi:ABC transporter [Lysinibacillus sp. SGAir0095]|uniref:ABC transporter n=1 Tax=Lysinibacillus sp. SGAir0095 TaxID=2070463 RepID=UPI0010CD65CC|nr:ABC transporter [Lysinibacillus sp. SGAir0095]QCR31222.1 ABC transporter [Lysinibacillus sp. SGAir0095]